MVDVNVEFFVMLVGFDLVIVDFDLCFYMVLIDVLLSECIGWMYCSVFDEVWLCMV